MSTFISERGRIEHFNAILTGTANVTLCTGKSRGSIVEHVRVCEVAGSTPSVIIEVYDPVSATAWQVRGNRPLTAYATEIDAAPIPLTANWVLRARATAGNQVHITGMVIDAPESGTA